MDDDSNRTYGIEKLAELLIERGIEFFVKDEVSLAYKDDVGNWHECWMAGASESHVNALIVATPEQLLSVPDLNGIIDENEKLRALVADMWHDGMCDCDERGACARCEYGYLERMRELGVEVES